MTLSGYMSFDFDIKSPAKLFVQTCIEKLDLPGDNATETIEAEPLEKKKTSYRIEGFQISEVFETLSRKLDVPRWPNLDGYKKLEGIISATHVEDNDLDHAFLTLEYEKINSDIEDPKSVMDNFVDLVTLIARLYGHL